MVWRIDTELVSPIETLSLTPWKYPRRIYVPYLQNGGQLNDRFLLGHPNAIASLIASRASLIASDCTFGEPAMIRLVKTLDLTVSFTRTRVVRRRFDLATTSVDAAATLGLVPPRYCTPHGLEPSDVELVSDPMLALDAVWLPRDRAIENELFAKGLHVASIVSRPTGSHFLQ